MELFLWLRSCKYKRQFSAKDLWDKHLGLPFKKCCAYNSSIVYFCPTTKDLTLKNSWGKPTWQNTPKKAPNKPSHSASSAPVVFLSGAAWVDELRIRDLSKNLMSLILPIRLILLIHYWSALYCTILHSSLTCWPLEIKDWSCAVGTSTMWFCFVQAWYATSTIHRLTGLCRL